MQGDSLPERSLLINVWKFVDFREIIYMKKLTQLPQADELLKMTFAEGYAFTLHTSYYLKHGGNNCWHDPENTLTKYTLYN